MTLILGLPWLWMVNAHIAIRDSKIYLGDPALNETVREVVGPEMFFSSEHNMLMYPKSLKQSLQSKQPQVETDDSSSGDDSSSDSDEEDIEGDEPNF